MAMRYNQWRLDYRPGGWIRARDETGMTVFFQVDLAGDVSLPRVHATLMQSPHEPISARSWRGAPFREVEMHSLFPEVRERLALPAEIGPVDNLNDYFDRTEEQYGSPHGGIPTAEIIGGPGEPPGGFTAPKPPGGRLTDEFLENVVAMYRWAVASGKAPGPTIAKAAEVPVSRVHRWVSEARKRGLLPPAVRGKAG